MLQSEGLRVQAQAIVDILAHDPTVLSGLHKLGELRHGVERALRRRADGHALGGHPLARAQIVPNVAEPEDRLVARIVGGKLGVFNIVARFYWRRHLLHTHTLTHTRARAHNAHNTHNAHTRAHPAINARAVAR